jgi:hypothetical protein
VSGVPLPDAVDDLFLNMKRDVLIEIVILNTNSIGNVVFKLPDLYVEGNMQNHLLVLGLYILDNTFGSVDYSLKRPKSPGINEFFHASGRKVELPQALL